MIDYDVDTAHSVVLVRPQRRLDTDDFVELAKAVDPQIEDNGDLAGVSIDAPSFPGWEDFGSMVSHFRFVRDHQKHVKKVAVVTDSALGNVAEHLASHLCPQRSSSSPMLIRDGARLSLDDRWPHTSRTGSLARSRPNVPNCLDGEFKWV